MSLKTFGQVCLLLVISAILFYVVFPKYYFEDGQGIRINRITGKTTAIGTKYDWFPVVEKK